MREGLRFRSWCPLARRRLCAVLFIEIGKGDSFQVSPASTTSRGCRNDISSHSHGSWYPIRGFDLAYWSIVLEANDHQQGAVGVGVGE